jgi:hypothetical protein
MLIHVSMPTIFVSVFAAAVTADWLIARFIK